MGHLVTQLKLYRYAPTHLVQLEAIKEFWSKGKRDGKIKNPEDLYIYNFFPVEPISLDVNSKIKSGFKPTSFL